MFLRCLVQTPKEKQCCCGAWLKKLRKTNVVAVSGVKNERKPMFVRCLVHNPKEKQCFCGARCKNLRKSNVFVVPGAKT